MPLTKFEDGITILTADVGNTWFGGLFGDPSAASLPPDDPLVAGHVHDGQRIDGHAQKINLTNHVTGELPGEFIVDGSVTEAKLSFSINTLNAEDEGVLVTGGPFDTFNFVGAGVTVTDGGSGTATVTVAGGGGTDTYLAPDEYYVDSSLANDSTKRQYATIADAIAASITAGDTNLKIRLADGTSNSWDGDLTGLTAQSIYIYSLTKYGGSLEFSSGATLNYNSSITLHNLSLIQENSPANPVSIGAPSILFSNCNGTLDLILIDELLGEGFQQITFNDCDFSGSENSDTLSILADASVSELTDTVNIEFNKTKVTAGRSSTFNEDYPLVGTLDNTPGSAEVNVVFDECNIVVVANDSDFYTLFAGDGNDLNISFKNSTLAPDVDCIIAHPAMDNAPNWQSCRISSSPSDKFVPTFRFTLPASQTEVGQQRDLVIETGSPIPVPAPGGTVAWSQVNTGNDSGRVGGPVVYNGDYTQWRGFNNTALLVGASSSTIGERVRYETANESDDVIWLNADSTGSMRSLQGRLIADLTPDGAAWDIDLIVKLDSSTSIFDAQMLSGGTPTLVYETNVGQFDLDIGFAIKVEIDDTTVTSDLIIGGVTLNANAGPRTPGSDDFDGTASGSEAVQAVSTSSRFFRIGGDFTFIQDGTQITVSGSTGNDGTYTVVNTEFSSVSGGRTFIYVLEPVTDPTGDGNVTIPGETLIAKDMADAINDGANSFTAICTASSNGPFLTIYSEVGGADFLVSESPSTTDIDRVDIGVTFTGTKNSASGFVDYVGEIKVIDVGTFV